MHDAPSLAAQLRFIASLQ